MAEYLRFAYTVADRRLGSSSLMPYVSMMLSTAERKIEISALLDSGATVNAIPFGIGQELGLIGMQSCHESNYPATWRVMSRK